MEAILQRLAVTPDETSIDPLRELVNCLRPHRAHQVEQAIANLQALCYLLEQHPEYRAALRRYLLALLASRRQVELYADSGLLSNDGLFTGLYQRLSYRILPPTVRPEYLKDVFGLVFHDPRDYLWLELVPDMALVDLARALHFEEDHDRATVDRIRLALLESVQVVSYRISAIGLEPELVRNHADLERFESPFLMQNLETQAFITRYKQALQDKATSPEDDRQILVLLDQCEAVIGKIRKHAARHGVSISLTYLLHRLRQHIQRLKTLLALLDPTHGAERGLALLAFVRELVRAENRKYSLRDLFGTSTDQIALRITENASQAGEHYIAATRAEHRRMLRSGMGAGLIIGFMALCKILLVKTHLPPLTEALGFCLNYALGFMLVHLLHFTIATKQPAMTAQTIAASIHQNEGGKYVLDDLAELCVKVCRTQLAAIFGNLIVVMPTAYAIARAWYQLRGGHLVSTDKAWHLLGETHPWASLAIPHAAIAGVCLFLAGLIAGYYDNRAVYNEMSDRLRQLGWLRRLLGPVRLDRFAGYVEKNLGALAGNFYFGIMLGAIGALGALVGLPIGIRHITFSGAYVSFALVGLDHQVPWQTLVVSLAGVFAIGLTNLVVSFTLALLVALRARRVSFTQSRLLLGKLLSLFFSHPLRFFFTPSATEDDPALVPALEAPAAVAAASGRRDSRTANSPSLPRN
ncbi:MAG TPA: site-specific recombinase [Polyangia bacterium]|nr:site-specific recombinase [Polyangia bacterium]